eukprot:9498368-Pyramimonas_sp.AAC.1
MTPPLQGKRSGFGRADVPRLSRRGPSRGYPVPVPVVVLMVVPIVSTLVPMAVLMVVPMVVSMIVPRVAPMVEGLMVKLVDRTWKLYVYTHT